MTMIIDKIGFVTLALAFVSGACASPTPNELFSGSPSNDVRGDTGIDAGIDREACATCSLDEASVSEGSTSDVLTGSAYDGGRQDALAVDVADSGSPLDADASVDGSDAPTMAEAAPQDAQQADRPACVSDCDSRRVFVTAKPLPNGSFGSVSAANAFCQSSADSRSLGGTWKAWISDTAETPLTTFTRITGPYRLLDGTIVAMGWSGLTRGTLLHAIDMTDARNSVPHGELMEVWTGTTRSGTTSDANCAHWTNGTSVPPYADVGLVGRIDSGWTQVYQQFCHLQNHLYCFEQ